VFTVNLRNGLIAAALLSTAALTVACGSSTAGTAAAGNTVASTSASTTSSQSSSSSSATSRPSTSIEDTPIDDPSTVVVVVQPEELDATTAIWLQNSCTDIGTLFGALFAIPTVDENDPVEDYRVAYRDYYASLSDTLTEMAGRMAVLDPPTIEGGQALHDGYLTYLITLAGITGGGAVAIDEAPADTASISAIVDQIGVEIDQLGQSDLGLADFQGAEIQSLIEQVPACDSLSAS
jgi:hypothetical protein